MARWGSSTVYHRSGWLRAVEETTGHSCVRLVAREHGNPVVALPLFRLKTGPLKAVLSPPPSLGIEYLGPLMDDELLGSAARETDRLRVMDELLSKVEEEYRPSLTYLRVSPSMTDGRPFTWNRYRLETLYTYVIRLRKPKAELLSAFHHSLRRDVRRADGKVEVRAGGKELCALAHDFIAARFRAQGMKFGPTKAYLVRLAERLGREAFEPIAAYTATGIEAVALVTYHGHRASFWQHAASMRPTNLPLTTCMAWHAIQIALERGYDEFELVGANTRRLVEYKSKFRPTLQPFQEASKASISGRSAMLLFRKLRS